MIKSHLLYQLSHGVISVGVCKPLFPVCECKITTFFLILQIFGRFFLKKMKKGDEGDEAGCLGDGVDKKTTKKSG